MVGDPFLNYFALGLLVFVVVVVFYAIIARFMTFLYHIAEKRCSIRIRMRSMPPAG